MKYSEAEKREGTGGRAEDRENEDQVVKNRNGEEDTKFLHTVGTGELFTVPGTPHPQCIYAL